MKIRFSVYNRKKRKICSAPIVLQLQFTSEKRRVTRKSGKVSAVRPYIRFCKKRMESQTSSSRLATRRASRSGGPESTAANGAIASGATACGRVTSCVLVKARFGRPPPSRCVSVSRVTPKPKWRGRSLHLPGESAYDHRVRGRADVMGQARDRPTTFRPSELRPVLEAWLPPKNSDEMRECRRSRLTRLPKTLCDPTQGHSGTCS